MNLARTSFVSSERAASLTEYALVVALMVLTTLVAIGALTSSAESVLIQTGDDVGTPRAPRSELLSSP